MVSFSWSEWLSGKSLSRHKSRQRPTSQTPHIEALEIRAMLTAPVAVDDSGYTVSEDGTLNATDSVLDNDTDDDSDTLTTAILDTTTTHGSLTLNADGTFVYTPNANFHGTDSFTYFAVDANDETSLTAATVTITVGSVADLDANDDSFTTDEDLFFSDNVATNDSTTSGGTLTYALDTDVSHGALTFNADGSFTYTPNSNFNGSDSFTYLVTDSDANESSIQTVTITVTAVTDLVANDDSFTTDEDTLFSDSVATNDSTTSGGSLTYALETDVSHGTLLFNVDGSFTYTPGANFNGSDSFSYLVTDADSGESSIQTVAITITAVSDLVANDDSFTTDEDTPFSDTVATNDSTTSGGSLTYALDTDVSHGTLVFNADGSFAYTPNSNFNGSDSFTYLVTDADSGESSIQTVAITITAIADLVANDDNFTTDEDISLSDSVATNDSTTSGGTLTYSLSTDVSHGTLAFYSDGSFVYAPNGNFNGSDSFTYLVTDADSGENSIRTVTLNITAVADLVANDDSFTTDEDTPFSDNVSTTSGGTLTYSLGTNVSHGTLTFNNDGSFTYIPNSNFHGTDTFTYHVTDADSGESGLLTVTITVTAVNDDPIADPDSIETDEDVPYNGTLPGSDVDGDTLTYVIGSVTPSHGTVTINPDGTYIYTPNANYFGSDSFSYTVSDGTVTSPEATVTITIHSVNDAPVADPTSFSTIEETPYSGTLTASDVEGDTLTFAIGTVTPSHGTVAINPDGTFTYTPAADFFGTDSFSFTVNDGTTTSAEATVTITVIGVNDAPTLTNGSGTVNEDTYLIGSVSSLGYDADGDPLTYLVITPPAHGILTLSPDGTFIYIPNANYSGTDSFTFKANDGQVDSPVATFSITVNSVDDPLLLNLPGGSVVVGKNNTPVRLDPGASVDDADTPINYGNAEIQVAILAGGSTADAKNGRVTIKIANQGTGAGLVKVKGSKIYFNGSSVPVATFSGGKNGKPLVIKFSNGATQDAVNAVLKQISVQASKKATTGNRTVGIQVMAGMQVAFSTKTARIV
ncbi:MAG: Ig-like domain-containing protein [Planctomycetota bacterium]